MLSLKKNEHIGYTNFSCLETGSAAGARLSWASLLSVLADSHVCNQLSRQAVTWGTAVTRPFSPIMQQDSLGSFTWWWLRGSQKQQERTNSMHKNFSSLCLCYICYWAIGQIKPHGQLQVQGWIKRLPPLSEKGRVRGHFCNLQITKSKGFSLWDLGRIYRVGKSRNRKGSYLRK